MFTGETTFVDTLVISLLCTLSDLNEVCVFRLTYLLEFIFDCCYCICFRLEKKVVLREISRAGNNVKTRGTQASCYNIINNKKFIYLRFTKHLCSISARTSD